MLDLDRDRHPPSNYERDTAQLLRRLKEAGQPIVLTINGQAELSVTDDQSYEWLLKRVDRLDALEELRQRLKRLDEGKGLSFEQVREEVRRKYGVSI